MKMTDKAKLEYILCAYLRPTFLILEEDDGGDIKIIVSTNSFSYLTIDERINKIFVLLYDKCPDILGRRLVIVEAYSSTELDEILDHLFNEELQ